jgi:hypothetical protein
MTLGLSAFLFFFFLGNFLIALVMAIAVAFFVSVAATIGWAQNTTRWRFYCQCFAITAVCFAAASLYGIYEVRRGEVRRLLPEDSLADRLGYKEEFSIYQRKTAAPLSPESEQAIESLESQIDGDPDAREIIEIIRRYHRTKVEEFINTSGFGVARRLGARPTLDFKRRRERIPLNVEPVPTAEIPQKSVANFKVKPGKNRLFDLHLASVVDFSNAMGLGLRENDRILAFQEHGFRKSPVAVQHEEESYRVSRLDLVSLLKHNRPLAYVSEMLPNMEELKDAPTRELDYLEARGISDLREGKELVLLEEPGRLRFVGAIRAGRQCLECHSVQRGELLGAFSYQMVRDGKR